MKENYYDKAISFEALYKGLKASCRGVRWKDSVIRYEAYGLRNTYKLRQSLLDGTYRVSPYQRFIIHEPKERIIYAPRLVDRQLQHSLCDNGLYEDITEHFIRDNFACQHRRGTDDALNRFKIHLRSYAHEHGDEGWALKCDIHHFFPTTPHESAKAAARKYIGDKRACDMVCQVIDSFDREIGLGLGSQISQITELLLLNDLDHFIKERLHIRYYVRYMDDFILIHNSKEYLQTCLKEIRSFIERLGLQLNKKTNIQPLKHGVIFLKWRYLLMPTGKVVMLMNRRKIPKEKRRLKKLRERCLDTKSSVTSFLANAKRGNTWRIQQEMQHFYCKLTGGELR